MAIISSVSGSCLCTLLHVLIPLRLIFISPFLQKSSDFRGKVSNLLTASGTSCLGEEIAQGTMLTPHKCQQPFFLATSKISGCALPSGRCWSAPLQSADFPSQFLGCDVVCSDKHTIAEVKLTLVHFALFQPLSADR